MKHTLTPLLALALLVSCGERKADTRAPDTAGAEQDQPFMDDENPSPPVTVPSDSVAPGVESLEIDSVPVRASPRGSAIVRGAGAQDSSHYVIRYSLTRAPRPGDTVQVRLGRDSTATYNRFLASRKKVAQRDTADLVIPKVIGSQARLYSCIRISAKGVNQPGLETCRNWTTNFAAPVDTTPPRVDTLEIDSSRALARTFAYAEWKDSTRKQAQFCAYFQMLDGKVKLAQAQRHLPVCRKLYDRHVALSRRLPGYPGWFVAAGGPVPVVRIKIEPSP